MDYGIAYEDTPVGLSGWNRFVNQESYPNLLASSRIPKPCAAILMIALGVFIYGMILLGTNREALIVYIKEDGVVQWLTMVALAASAIYAFLMSVAIRKQTRFRGASVVWCLLGILLVFGAMEEISWGQRIFVWKSPEWFIRHNAQQETNIHNLVIGGVKLNKLVFGKVLAILLFFYMLVLPILYRFNTAVKKYIDRFTIPICQNYQVLTLILIFVAIDLSHIMVNEVPKKINELHEFFGSVIFFLILTHPYNKIKFKTQRQRLTL